MRRGRDSIYVTQDAVTRERIGKVEAGNAQAMAHFRLGLYLNERGYRDAAVEQFKLAHTLQPDNWNYKRQAWNLGDIETDYGTTFQKELQSGIPFYPPLDLPEPNAS